MKHAIYFNYIQTYIAKYSLLERVCAKEGKYMKKSNRAIISYNQKALNVKC